MLIGPQNLPEALQRVRERIGAAAGACARNVDSVTLLAVSKSQPAGTIAMAAREGVEHFGENYLQEALAKIRELRSLGITWHFIGQVQANKTRPVAEEFAWVHSVDRVRIAERLSAQRPYHAPPLNVCVQVNVLGEATKGGVSPAEAPALLNAVASLPRIALRGLMCMLPEGVDPETQRRGFAALRQLLESANAGGARLDTLSMGMSSDFEAAIREGATIVRIGSAIFGPRPAAGRRG
jgi:pyridoxal phosphate enzyme (YggS family)